MNGMNGNVILKNTKEDRLLNEKWINQTVFERKISINMKLI